MSNDINVTLPILEMEISWPMIGSINYQNVKSISIDITNNWAGTGHGTLRSIEFYSQGNLLPFADSDITCYRYLYNSASYKTTRHAKYAFITGLSKIGTDASTQWESADESPPCRISCVFDTPINFDKVVINNGHVSGASTTLGVKDVIITASSDTITSIVYDAAISNSTEIYNGEIAQHITSNIEANEVIVNLYTTILPALTAIIGSGAMVEFTVPALTCILEANKFSFAGNLIDSLGALTMTGVTDQYREVEGSLGALTASLAAAANFIRLTPDFPVLEAALYSGGHIETEFPELISLISGKNNIVASLVSSFPALTALGYFGSISTCVFPSLTAAISATNIALVSVTASMPSLSANIIAEFKMPTAVALSLPGLTLSGTVFHSPNGQIETSFPAFTMQATGINGLVATIEANIPFFRKVRIVASQEQTNEITAQIPAFEMEALSSVFEETVLRYIRGQLR